MTDPCRPAVRRVELTPLHVPFRPVVREAMRGPRRHAGLARDEAALVRYATSKTVVLEA